MRKYILLAEKMGAEGAEIFHLKSQSYSISEDGGGIDSAEYNSTQGYCIRIVKNGRVGFSHFTTEEDAGNSIKIALSLSKFSKRTGLEFPDKSKYQKVDVFDSRVSSLDGEGGIRLLRELVSSIEKPAKPTHCGLECEVVNVELENSSGLSIHEKSTGISCFAHCNVGKSGGSSFRISTHLDFSPSEVGLEASQRAKDMVGGKMIGGGGMQVVFEAEALHSLISSLLLPSFHGKNIYRGVSMLRGKLGKRIAPECLTLLDDPLSKGPAMEAFDGEGVPGKQKALIKDGVVSSFLFDLETASMSKEHDPAPGNCHRSSYMAMPNIGVSNIIIERGDCGNALEACGNGLLVCSVFGEHTANDLTGEFSVSVDRGFAIERGERGAPARGNVISGNIFELLKRISAVEKRLERYANIMTPRIAFEIMDVVG
ncbi:MAG: TldD/PmbA family protein [Candidatus Micrarchaeota archaeon]